MVYESNKIWMVTDIRETYFGVHSIKEVTLGTEMVLFYCGVFFMKIVLFRIFWIIIISIRHILCALHVFWCMLIFHSKVSRFLLYRMVPDSVRLLAIRRPILNCHLIVQVAIDTLLFKYLHFVHVNHKILTQCHGCHKSNILFVAKENVK